MWKADGSMDQYKARLVSPWLHLTSWFDYTKTFNPGEACYCPSSLTNSLVLGQFIRSTSRIPSSMGLSLRPSIAVSLSVLLTAHPNMVCKLKSLYSLKRAPHTWYSRFATYLLSLGFTEAKLDTSLFIYQHGSNTICLLLYIDDIVIIVSSSGLLHRIIRTL
jgi:hypothetical protein